MNDTAKFIAKDALGSETNTRQETDEYRITHMVGESDFDSQYSGTFYGYHFVAELYGIQGEDYCGIALSSPTLSAVIESILDAEVIEEPVPSKMPEDMKLELATALLAHHEASYDEWANGEGGFEEEYDEEEYEEEYLGEEE